MLDYGLVGVSIIEGIIYNQNYSYVLYKLICYFNTNIKVYDFLPSNRSNEDQLLYILRPCSTFFKRLSKNQQ